MADFTVIETQEQLDKVIGERIRRAEEKAIEKAAEQFADYDALKTQNDELSKQVAQLTEQLTKQTELIDGNKTVVDDLTAKVQAYETASVKTKIALELGLPYQMAERLAGSSEDEIRKDAETMVGLIKSNQPVAPLASNEPTATNTDPSKVAERQFGEWLNQNFQ